MERDFIPVNTPDVNGNEKKYIDECIDTGWISSEGEFVKRFEQGMADLTGRKYAYAVSSGTAALETAVKALNLPAGSEVIMPDFTIISCANAIIKAGLVPVTIDCTLDDWNIDAEKIEERITNKTKAIMIVHIYGLCTNIDKVLTIARKYNLKVIEDAAEAIGLKYKDKECGSFGDVSIFSFYANKHISCGEGGMVLTNDEKISTEIKNIRNLYFDCERKYIHEEIGSNFRMTNIQAALGLAQLEKLEKTIKKKKEIGKIYTKGFEDFEAIQIPLSKSNDSENVYWVFGVVLKNKDDDVDSVMRKLKKMSIGTRHFFYPIHKQPCLIKRGLFNNCTDDEYINSVTICERGFYLPSGVGLREEEQIYIIDSLKQILI